ncbi:MAG TPA: S8 family serine peptidase [Gemmatimonadaceae bacterium]|nr:S8 family serine peptidase [Gemmatimonadaceae bacterium]
MFSFTRSRPLMGAVVLAVAAGCADQSTVTAPQRSFSPTALASREAVPVSGTHIFALQQGVPENFAAVVAAKGGVVQLVQGESKLAITTGLSDADAAAIATAAGGLVGGDLSARWVPTAQEMNVSASSDVTATGAFTQTPLAAAWLPQQWNMQQIHAPEAWAAGKFGSSAVRVAILDTGLDPNHQELFGVVDGGSSTTCLKAPACVRGGTGWFDDYFHGTFVGGIVSANNFVTAAMAPNVRLIAVKVLDSTGTGSFSAILRGIMYAVDSVHARVINMSLGATIKGNTPGLGALQQALANAIDYADSKGTVVVTAAGNEDLNLGNPHPHLSLPCEAGDKQLCVSATDPRDMIARYSNFGWAGIDVAAPGGDDKHLPRGATFQDALALLIAGPCSGATPRSACFVKGRTIGFSYIVADGTSASAPHVAGLAALIASQPGGSAMSAADIRARIRSTADDIGNGQKFGDGRINVARALGVQ